MTTEEEASRAIIARVGWKRKGGSEGDNGFRSPAKLLWEKGCARKKNAHAIFRKNT